jgi:hypothetical protein
LVFPRPGADYVAPGKNTLSDKCYFFGLASASHQSSGSNPFLCIDDADETGTS